MRSFCLAAAVVAAAGTASAEGPELTLPLDCEPQKTCHVQNLVDIDPGPGRLDYACGALTYDGHKGVDFRVRRRDADGAGIAVLAAASGRVAGLRDGMDDVLVTDVTANAAVKDRECGNGVAIDHGDGWVTQYCHMRKNSVAVRPGDHVERGTRLGLVGYSGMTQFPHAHVTLRHNHQIVDPFTGREPDAKCGADTAGSMWAPSLRTVLAYRTAVIADAGFADSRVSFEDVDAGMWDRFAATPDTPVLVAWLWVLNPRGGDTLTIVLSGPDGDELARNTETLAGNRAQQMLFAGRKKPAGDWPAGRYLAAVTIDRGGRTLASESRTLNIDRQ